MKLKQSTAQRGALSDTNASGRSVIDTLTFITTGTVPNDGQIVVVVPTAFTINTSLDSASLQKGNTRTLLGDIGNGGISSITNPGNKNKFK